MSPTGSLDASKVVLYWIHHFWFKWIHQIGFLWVYYLLIQHTQIIINHARIDAQRCWGCQVLLIIVDSLLSDISPLGVGEHDVFFMAAPSFK